MEHLEACIAEREQNDREIEEWRKRWPDHCKGCHGAGGAVSYSYPHEPDSFDECGTCSDAEVCPRCGEGDQDVDGLYDGQPCHTCGWTGQGPDDQEPVKIDGPCGCEIAQWEEDERLLEALNR